MHYKAQATSPLPSLREWPLRERLLPTEWLLSPEPTLIPVGPLCWKLCSRRHVCRGGSCGEGIPVEYRPRLHQAWLQHLRTAASRRTAAGGYRIPAQVLADILLPGLLCDPLPLEVRLAFARHAGTRSHTGSHASW